MYMHIPLNSKLFITCLLYIVICNLVCAEETYTYDARGRRDPFIPLLKPIPPPLQKPEPPPKEKKLIECLEDIESIEDARFYVHLQGIAYDASGKKVAILNDEMVEEGETVGRLTVKRIFKNEVTLSVDKEEYKLNIYELEEGG